MDALPNPDRRVRRRRRTLTAATLMLTMFGAGALTLASRFGTPDMHRPDVFRLIGLLALSTVVAVRATTAFTLLRRDPVLQDELTQQNRLHAARWGFWAMFAVALALCVASFFRSLTVPEATIGLIWAGAFVSALRFVRLEAAGDREG